MPLWVEKTGGKRLFLAGLVLCGAAMVAGCSQTTGSVAPSAATSTRSDFADSGQPITLNGGAAAGSQAATATPSTGAAAAKPQATAVATTNAPKVEGPVIELAPRVATVAAKPAPAPSPEPTDAISLMPAFDPAPAETDQAFAPATEEPAPAAAAETQSTEVLSDGPQADGQISADAKAKLIGDLEALKKRPGVAAEGSAAAAGAADCAEGSLDPQCAATQ